MFDISLASHSQLTFSVQVGMPEQPLMTNLIKISNGEDSGAKQTDWMKSVSRSMTDKIRPYIQQDQNWKLEVMVVFSALCV